jgi:hypothetical protein
MMSTAAAKPQTPPAEEKIPERSNILGGATVTAIIPRNIDETYRLAQWVAKAGWAPKGYRLKDANDKDTYVNGQPVFDEMKIAVAIMHGLEVGFTPIAALQSIAVINGMPSIFGDGALALCQASGLMEWFKEEPHYKDANSKTVIGYTCTAKRRGDPVPKSHTFTLEDAVKAKLVGKAGPWTEYPQRMLQMRPRAWTLRAASADVLRGLHIAEEAMDITESVILSPAPAPAVHGSAGAALDAFAGNTQQALPAPVDTTLPAKLPEPAETAVPP